MLSGNKSLDNLGIQSKLTFDSAPTEDSENPVESGGVYGALAGKQDTISDLSAIRSGAAAGATAVQPTALETALAQKQDALSSEQLDAVNSGITSADVEQITTNKNNILYNANQGVKNIFDFDSWYNSLTGATRATITATTNGITLTATGNDSYTTPQVNGYHIPVKPNTSYTVTLDSSDSNGQLVFLENDGFSKVYVCETGTKTLTFTTSATADRLSVRFGVPTSGNASTITNIMVQLASISDTTYQPYAMSNAELTAQRQTRRLGRWVTSFTVETPVFGASDDGGTITKVYIYMGGTNTGLSEYILASESVSLVSGGAGVSYSISGTTVTFTTTSTCLAYAETLHFDV